MKILDSTFQSLIVLLVLAVLLLPHAPQAETHFIEAESFSIASGGWEPVSNPQVRSASRTTTLSGASGPGDGMARSMVNIEEAGPYRIWVRSIQVAAWRGPFVVSVHVDGQVIATRVIDLESDPAVKDWEFGWHSLEAKLPAGEVTLALTKYEAKNCNGYVRQVDCILVTNDLALVPDHVPFGPQTFIRVATGPDVQEPVYLHFFADHYRAPWYSHHALGHEGVQDQTTAPSDERLGPDETSAWGNISHTVYQDSGVALNLSMRHTYAEMAERLRATVEFGRAEGPDHVVELVKSFEIDAHPNGVVIVVPPDLDSPENIALLRRDLEFAVETGERADSFSWPTIGRRPTRIPFLVSARIGGYNLDVDADVAAREQKTLDYFGFNGSYDRVLHGLWFMDSNSYCQPNLTMMGERIQQNLNKFKEAGRSVDDIAYVSLMDEPMGQSATFMAEDESYITRFRAWVKEKGLTPEDLLVANWDGVRPIEESMRDEFPALHYYTQRFRTVALGDFMAVQRGFIEEAYGHEFPTVVNFSDGAVYYANFYGQGVDYFELLDSDSQNAIWGEDWANNASTNQCASFNVDLMRAAARKRDQAIGHYLIAHAGRTAWDTKLKATSETARGVRLWMNFSYGPAWGTHEGGSAWKSHVWYNRLENWTANAEVTREIGAVEDWLLTAKPAPTDVALLYSSSTDIWSLDNASFGFDRMHMWLALSHGQVPVDVVSERDVAMGQLEHYRVCYLSGQNLTREASAKLRNWVEGGGHLIMTAGAATRDEFNRPLASLDPILPVDRGELIIHQPYRAAGRFLPTMAPKDSVLWEGEALEVLGVQQGQDPRVDAKVLATFSDGAPAVVEGAAGQGQITSIGFLPGLSYIRPALAARAAAEKTLKIEPRIGRSYNPWDFPAGVRERILAPLRAEDTRPLLGCDVSLVDAVYLPCEQGVLIALANYTLKPIEQLTLHVRGIEKVTRVASVHHGDIPFELMGSGEIRLVLPLGASDWIKVSGVPESSS